MTNSNYFQSPISKNALIRCAFQIETFHSAFHPQVFGLAFDMPPPRGKNLIPFVKFACSSAEFFMRI